MAVRALPPLALAGFLLLLSLAARADEPASFQSLTTDHFHFEFPEQQRKVVLRLAESAEAVRSRHCRLISPCFEGPIKVQIARSQDQFLDLQPYQAHIDWAAGVAYADLSLIILRVDKDILLTIEETFEHEVSHVLLLKAVRQRPPRWFIEGMAIVQARQDLISKFEEVVAATISDRALSLSDIATRFPSSPSGRALAYAQSGLFVGYLVSRFGDEKVRALVQALGKETDFASVFAATMKEPLSQVEADWKASFGSYGWLKSLTESWLLWGTAALLLVLGVGRQLQRRRKARALLVGDEGADWEYRSKD
jgi:hypothetical protein